MPEAFSNVIVTRLWKLICAIRKEICRKDLPSELNCTERALGTDIGRLKKIGIGIRYSRIKDLYTVDFPENSSINLKLNDQEFFFSYYLLAVTKNNEFKELEQKMMLASSEVGSPVFDCGPAYGIGNPVTGKLEKKILDLKNAIIMRKKTVLQYCKFNAPDELILVHPLKLIHTPISWYLLAWNEKKRSLRRYKLIRISNLMITENSFHQHNITKEEIFGDSWWLQYDPKKMDNPYKVVVRFFGESAKAIQEYNFHASQKVEEVNGNTVVSWEMSYLNEFATWLMQWLDSIEILEPQELKNFIEHKIEKYRILSADDAD
ncbi:MAG: WYL domain-containing protein [Kiritimatiellae bacterium]|jgi:predicted DNA-binding transcriptional regulator YafY|nr:WYL domain-containing protein [Kiritimatiellia bacterium]